MFQAYFEVFTKVKFFTPWYLLFCYVLNSGLTYFSKLCAIKELNWINLLRKTFLTLCKLQSSPKRGCLWHFNFNNKHFWIKELPFLDTGKEWLIDWVGKVARILILWWLLLWVQIPLGGNYKFYWNFSNPQCQYCTEMSDLCWKGKPRMDVLQIDFMVVYSSVRKGLSVDCVYTPRPSVLYLSYLWQYPLVLAWFCAEGLPHDPVWGTPCTVPRGTQQPPLPRHDQGVTPGTRSGDKIRSINLIACITVFWSWCFLLMI